MVIFLQHLELEINFIFEGKNSTEAANQSLNVPVASSSKKEREHPMNVLLLGENVSHLLVLLRSERKINTVTRN